MFEQPLRQLPRPATRAPKGTLHAPAETGTDPTYANRSASKKYRATPLRGLAQHPPYFHDGSAADLAAVVDHYDQALGLGMSAGDKADLIAYLKSISASSEPWEGCRSVTSRHRSYAAMCRSVPNSRAAGESSRRSPASPTRSEKRG